MQVVSAAIDDTMGEPVTVTPCEVSRPNFPAVPDASRAATVRAVFTSKAETVSMGNEHRFAGQCLSPRVSTSKPVFSFAYGEAVSSAPFSTLFWDKFLRCSARLRRSSALSKWRAHPIKFVVERSCFRQ
jgi:hypothetical protein